jgi:hypothetical protein
MKEGLVDEGCPSEILKTHFFLGND